MDWPTAEEVAAQLGLTWASLPADKQEAVSDATAAAVEQVTLDVGAVDTEGIPVPITAPTASLKRAALLLAVTVVSSPNAPYGIAQIFDTGALYVARDNPNYTRLLHGHRLTFGVS